MQNFIEWHTEDDNGDEVIYQIPAKYEVCSRCNGHGTHVNPSIDGNGITESEWNGPDWSDEDKETYMSGGYDVECSECSGNRVVLVPNFNTKWPQDIKTKYKEHLEKEYKDRMEREYEIKMGY